MKNKQAAFWKINSEKEFEEFAIKTFNYQFNNNIIYRSYCDLLNINSSDIKKCNQIPFLPIELFKSNKIKSFTENEKYIFYSSSNLNKTKSKHYINDIFNYQKSYLNCFNLFYGNLKNYNILALLPSYIERENSSLIYMVNDFINKSENNFSGFYINEFERLFSTLNNLEKEKKSTILIGVSFALLDFIEFKKIHLKNTIVMETGGMKGKRKELIREDLHEKLKNGFGVSKIHSEYGMTELLSQAYSKGNGLFNCPPWMKISIRDTNDPLINLPSNTLGAINIIDLANQDSCAFIATQDLGIVKLDNSFEVIGRMDDSDKRGCNLMIY